MSKYSKEFKLEVIKYYEKNHIGCGELAEHFNISNRSVVRWWIKNYQEHGINGLIRNNIKYTGEFKQNVVEYMRKNHLSLNETAAYFNLGNHNIVGKWERIYYEKGPQALYKEQRGRNKKDMSSKHQKKKLSKENEEDLIEEVQRLRMENAYLKKLQALVQERTKPKQSKK